MAAESLDDEAKQLLDRHEYDAACAKFGESYRLAPGNGVLLRLGLCQELQGKTASAWSTFREAAARARVARDERAERVATARAAALEPRLSRLTIRLDVGTNLRDRVRVTRDGVALGPAALDAPLLADPGPHVIEATAPGARPFSVTVVVREGGANDTVTVTLDEALAPTRPAGPTAHAAADDRRNPTWSTQKTLALTAGGLGLAGLGVGVAYRLVASSKHDRLESLCPDKNNCSPEALAVRDDGKSALKVSNAAFAVGAAGVVGGLVLWLTAPRSRASQVSLDVAPQRLGLQLAGVW